MSIRRWEKYQSRTDKKMPWCKLWGLLFDEPWWQEMPDNLKVLPMILLDSARKFENFLPQNATYYERNYNVLLCEKDWSLACNILIEGGFLSDIAVGRHARPIRVEESRTRKQSVRQTTNIITDTHLLSEFENLWAKYPRKLGKETAKKSFIKLREKGIPLDDIQIAVTNYVSHINMEGTAEKYIKHGSTFFNQWEDWKTVETTQSSLSPAQRATLRDEGKL